MYRETGRCCEILVNGEGHRGARKIHVICALQMCARGDRFAALLPFLINPLMSL